MSKSPFEATLEFIRKRIEKEKDKYYSGTKNDFFLWEDYETTFLKAHEAYNNECRAQHERFMKEREAMKKKGEF